MKKESRISTESEKLDLEKYGVKDEGEYGFGSWTPSWMQWMNRLSWFTFFMFALCVFQGATVNGFVNVSISTLEQRFGFDSWMTGLMAVSYDIGFVLVSFYVSFVLVKGHIPKTIAKGFFLLGCGSIIFSLPHFITGKYEYGQSPENICPAHEECENVESKTNMLWYIAMFIFAQLCHGFGSTPLYTIGFSYIEDSTSAEDGALYFAIILMGSCLGPAIGFVFGAVQLGVWVDIPDEPGPDMDPSNPQWVGAWWIGMLACGIGAIICSIPMFGFPKQFPGVAKIRSEKVSETVEKKLVESDVSLIDGIKTLLKNPVFLFAGFGSAMDGYLSSCIMTFGPKIYEIRFHKTAGQAAFQAGIACVPGAILGSFLGGVIAKCFKMTGRQMMYFSTLSAVIVLIFYTLAMQISCGEEILAGVNTNYPGDSLAETELDLTSSCNADCTCSLEYFNPVCADGITYFSPCHAGCQTINGIDESLTNYTNCACAEKITDIATDGACANPELDTCESKSYLFLALVFILVCFEFLPPTIVPIATLRAVDPKLKGLSMGLQWDILRIFGSIPGPIVLGKLMDNACKVWEEVCDEKRSCWFYDDQKMYLAVFVLPIAMKVVNIGCFFLAGYYFRPAAQDEKGEKYELAKTEASTDTSSVPSTDL